MRCRYYGFLMRLMDFMDWWISSWDSRQPPHIRDAVEESTEYNRQRSSWLWDLLPGSHGEEFFRKIRTACDGVCHEKCLNDFISSGPALQNPFPVVLIRFREKADCLVSRHWCDVGFRWKRRINHITDFYGQKRMGLYRLVRWQEWHLVSHALLMWPSLQHGVLLTTPVSAWRKILMQFAETSICMITSIPPKIWRMLRRGRRQW